MLTRRTMFDEDYDDQLLGISQFVIRYSGILDFSLEPLQPVCQTFHERGGAIFPGTKIPINWKNAWG